MSSAKLMLIFFCALSKSEAMDLGRIRIDPDTPNHYQLKSAAQGYTKGAGSRHGNKVRQRDRRR